VEEFNCAIKRFSFGNLLDLAFNQTRQGYTKTTLFEHVIELFYKINLLRHFAVENCKVFEHGKIRVIGSQKTLQK
jgi:hypothetical protein